MLEDKIPLGLTFDDVLLIPAYTEVIPKDIDISTQLTPSIKLNIPLISSAMDTVTESKTAICMAREGGIGIIHKNLSIKSQSLEVDKVKKSESGMIVDPITMHPEQKLYEALEIMARYHISGVPVVKDDKLVGILTNRDLRFETNVSRQISEFMTMDNLITAPVGISLNEAKKLLHKNRIEKLLVVDEKNNLKGLITVKDIEKKEMYPNACKDHFGRLRVGAAIGVGKEKEVITTTKEHKKSFPDCQLIVGNVATADAADALIKAGVDAVKVGVGPGSICTTRVIAGIGIPQITAIMNCSKLTEKHGIPLIADGGIKFSGDVTKAIAAGAHTLMVGSLFAGTEESPGETVLFQGRSYKVYRGMGSLEAMKKGSKDRYFQTEVENEKKLVPEGIEGRVPHRGSLSSSIYQLVGGLRAGMGYVGCKNIEALRKNGKFIKITPSGLKESHVHGVIITKEAPNYRLE
jgi:IMP dehydrogenase